MMSPMIVYSIFVITLVLLSINEVSSFRGSFAVRGRKASSLSMMHDLPSFLNSASQFLADTSIGEEDVLAITGQTSELPDPKIAVGIAAVLFIGIGALQFTLGDLNKEEGQARVRDFLATRRDTERKRGYFD